MARNDIDIGIEGNDGTGDSIRESFRKVNENFTELYAVFGQGGNISVVNLDDTPDTYVGKEGRLLVTQTDGLGTGFYKLVSDGGLDDEISSVNTISFTVDDDTQTVKIRAINTKLSQDPAPTLSSELNAGATVAYNNTINTALLNESGSGNDIDNLVANWNVTHGASAGNITTSNVLISKGYADQTYINDDGDTMEGVLRLQDSGSPRVPTSTDEAVNKQYVDDTFVDVAGDTMTGTLFLDDHPGALAGQGTPNGPEDLQAATKYYVDNTSYASTTNLYVSTQGDDSQALTPPGKEGRAPSYAFRSVNAACEFANNIVNATPYEPGPYVQTLTYRSGGESVASTVSTAGVASVPADREAAMDYLQQLKDDIGRNVVSYVNTTYPDFTYDNAICARDVEYIIDSIALDVKAGLTRNYLTVWAGKRYYANPSATMARVSQQTETVAALTEAKRLAGIELRTRDTGWNAFATAVEERFDIVITMITDDDSTAGPEIVEAGSTYDIQMSNGAIGLEQGNPANRDIIAGKVLRGVTSGATAEIISYTYINGSNDDFSLALLTPIEFQVGEEVEIGNKTRNNQISVRVESGIYYEHMPIKVPENCSIKGDEFRRTIIRPKPGPSQSPWNDTYFYRSSTFDTLTTSTAGLSWNHPNPTATETGYFGHHYMTDPTDPLSTPKDNTEMDVFLCNDGVVIRNITCQKHGGFMMVLDPAGQILTRSPYAQTCSSFAQSKGINRVFTGGQFIDGYSGNLYANITGVGAGGFEVDVTSPANHGLFKRKPNVPFPFYISGVRYQVNYVKDYDQQNGTATLVLDSSTNPGSEPTINQITGINLSTTITITTASNHGYNNGTPLVITDVNGTIELNGNTYYAGNVTATTFDLYSDSGVTTLVDGSSFTAYTTGGEVKNVISGTGYSGATDGSQQCVMQTGGNRSMLANDYTQLNDNGFGIVAHNNALTEQVSTFTYYCHTGYYASNGSQIRSLTGNNSYGTYGLVSEGSDPDEIPEDTALAADMVFPCKVFRAQYQLRFGVDVSSNVSAGDYVFRETTLAKAIVSFVTNNGKDVFVYNTTGGVWNTTDDIRVSASNLGDAASLWAGADFIDGTAAAGSPTNANPTLTSLWDASADEGDLTVYAYDFTGLPNNVSEVEIFHKADDIYQPYEVTNATTTGKYLGGYTSEASGSEADYTTSASGTGATFRIEKTVNNGYSVTIVSGGSGYSASPADTFTVDGSLLGGATSTNDATITVVSETSGVITTASISGTPATDSFSPVENGKVWKLNLGTGIEGTAENGLQKETYHDTPIVFRHKQNFVFDGITDVPTRPSTALNFTGDPNNNFTYRTIAFTRTITDVDAVETNQRVITFDSNFDYVDLNLIQDKIVLPDNVNITPAITGADGSNMGDSSTNTKIAISKLSATDAARLNTGEMLFTWGGKKFQITGYSEHTLTTDNSEFAVIRFTDDENVINGASGGGLNEWPGLTGESGLTSARGITLKAGLAATEAATITVNISTTRATSHDMLDIGTGGYNQTNYPDRIFGSPISAPANTNDAIDSTGNASKAQIQERTRGRVFAVTTDQDGFFRVGRFFTVDQGTGSVTFNAALVLTNIDGIGFKRGVRVNEFSNDDSFTDAQGDAVPTQTAVEGYINARLGRDRDGDELLGSNIIPSGGGFLYKAGDTMNGNINMDSNRITNLVPNIGVGTDAANIQYVNDKTDELNDIGDVTVVGTGSTIEGDILMFTGSGSTQASENVTVGGDIGFSYTSTGVATTAISAGVIEDADVNASAAIAQSKLSMERAGTFDEDDAVNGWEGSAAQTAQSFVGLTAFSDENFEVEQFDFGGGAEDSGRVRIKDGGVGNDELANSGFTLSDGSNTQTPSLGDTLTFSGTANEVTVTVSATNTITMSLPGTINANTTGNAATADQIDTIQRSTDADHYVTFVDSDNVAATAETLYTDGGIKYNPNSGLFTLAGNILPDANNTRNIGADATGRYNTIYATVFDGTATEALYADLAENYLGDTSYEPGTVLVFGGDAEVTICNSKGDRRVAGVVTTNPAHLMNSHLKGEDVVGLALTGRVPCKVIGRVEKGDLLVTSAVPGYAIVDNDPKVGTIIGKALENKPDMDKGVIEVVVGRV